MLESEYKPRETRAPDYRCWHLPLARDRVSLAQARRDLARVSAAAGDIPLMVQLIENPKYRLPGIDFFPGRVDLQQHDAIHILLGRGLLSKDEAFTIGFTMGSTRKVSVLEEDLFIRIATHLYPAPYRLSQEDIDVFRDSLRLADIMRCKPLDNIDFSEYEQQPLATARALLGIDTGLLRAYYRLEKNRYPQCPASRRLLDK